MKKQIVFLIIISCAVVSPAWAESKQILQDWPICSTEREAALLATLWFSYPTAARQLLREEDERARRKKDDQGREFPHCRLQPEVVVSLIETGEITAKLSRRYSSVISAEYTDRFGNVQSGHTFIQLLDGETSA